MSEDRFLNSSPRQIKTLMKFHRKFNEGILLEAAGKIIESLTLEESEEYEVIEIESLADI